MNYNNSFNMDRSTIIPKYEKLFSLDRRTVKIMRKLVDLYKKYGLFGSHFGDRSMVVADIFHHAGSSFEGTMLCRLFQTEYYVGELDMVQEIIDVVDDVEPTGTPGFYKVRNSGAELVKENHPHSKILKKFFQETYKDEYISCNVIRYILSKMFEVPMKNKRPASDFFVPLLGEFAENFKWDAKTEIHGPAVTLNLMVTDDGYTVSDILLDIVSSAKLSAWPFDVRETWENRARKFPSPRDVTEITEGAVHLVPKSSDPDGEREDEWYLSFTHAERRLSQIQTDGMRFTYFVFKVLFYVHFKKFKIDDKSLSSYVAKTTMMWACEDLDPDAWSTTRMEQNLRYLMHKLRGYLKVGMVPHYFLPELNVIANTRREILAEVNKIPDDIEYNPLNYLPDPEQRTVTLGLIVAGAEEEKSIDYMRQQLIEYPWGIMRKDALEELQLSREEFAQQMNAYYITKL